VYNAIAIYVSCNSLAVLIVPNLCKIPETLSALNNSYKSDKALSAPSMLISLMFLMKIKSYSHQELNTSEYIDNVDKNIENNIDPFFRGSLTKVDIDSSYPEYILNNLQKDLM
jgi:uncharacterized membrane-anchored protein YitT (DUF2179 family)